MFDIQVDHTEVVQPANTISFQVGLNAMKLACRVAKDFHDEVSLHYLDHDIDLIEETNICLQSEKSFCKELSEYLVKRGSIYTKQESYDRATRSAPFSMNDAKAASLLYTDLLWRAIRKRLQFTDLTQSPCAYSEAPAEGIFSIYGRVSKGRESATVDHLVALTRVAAHGPPAGTEDAAKLSKDAMQNFKSRYGERFCSRLWMLGNTSSTVTNLRSAKWDW